MKLQTAITALALVGLTGIRAQNVPPETPEDPVQRAIREFNQRDKSKTNEITVTLAPPQETSPPPADGKNPDAQANSGKTSPTPMLVTGNPPDDTDVIEHPTSETASPAAGEDSTEAPAPPPQQGLAVRVEKLQTGSGNIDPAKVKLLAPFPAKPLAQAPAGWRLESSENAPPFTRDVELAPGKKITLTIRPHLLVPEADGATVFAVAEPGFDSSLGYRQHATVGAVLSRSIRQLDDDSKDLGNAIDNLQQLLVSLPKPETQPIPAEATKPARKR